MTTGIGDRVFQILAVAVCVLGMAAEFFFPSR
jgi:hypothetical protein